MSFDFDLDSLPKTARDDFRSLAYRLTQLHAGLLALRKQTEKKAAPAWLLEAFRARPAAAAYDPQSGLELPISHDPENSGSFQWEPSRDDPDSPSVSLLLALVRVPQLVAFWHRELGAATHASALRLLPPAWLLDPTPVPPGQVLDGWEITDWSLLPSHPGASGMEIHSPEGKVTPVTAESLQTALDLKNHVLRPSPRPVTAVLRYAKNAKGRLELVSAS